MIHGTADSLVSPQASKRYDEGYARSSLHLLKGVDHEFYRGMEEAAGVAVDFLANHVK